MENPLMLRPKYLERIDIKKHIKNILRILIEVDPMDDDKKITDTKVSIISMSIRGIIIVA